MFRVANTEVRTMDWAAVHKIWDKWASNHVGCSGEQCKCTIVLWECLVYFIDYNLLTLIV